MHIFKKGAKIKPQKKKKQTSFLQGGPLGFCWFINMHNNYNYMST